jgi:diguanylate cyclase (GGDEF)-like protein/PAS domain S-box-containing protein
VVQGQAWSVGNWIQLALLLAAIALAFLYWHLVSRRREQEAILQGQIRERDSRLNLALWGSGDEFWDWNVRDKSLYRLGAARLLGQGSLETMSTDDWRNNSIHPEDWPRVQKLLEEHISGASELFESEHRVRTANGEWIWVRSRGKVVERDTAGNPLRMAGTARDITVARRAERERRVALEVLRSMSEAVAVIDLDFCFISVNPSFSRITGYAEEEVAGQNSSLLDSGQHSPDFYRRVRDILERTGHWAGEMWQRRKDDEEFLGWIEMSEVRDSMGIRSHFVAVVNDITDKKRAEQELRYLANYDTLTGLPNRALLSERLGRAIVRARRQETRVAVLFLDLDRFKDINDSMGHAAGDRLLKAAATRLQATVSASDTVARLGGDEFTVVLEDVEGLMAVERMARDILIAFTTPLEVDERHDVSITPSLGISLYPDHALVPTDLLKFADTAMYQAKAEGRNTYQIYNETMDTEARQRAAIISALRKAIERNEFRLMYQPRMSLADGSITGVEALLRWKSADLGELSPSVFVPLAEESGLILSMGEWVIRAACQQLKAWRQQGLHEISVGINISVLQLLRGNVPVFLQEQLRTYGLPADRIELEVTESMVMQNAQQATAVLNELRKIGVSLAIDDFGTGYSSLVYLKRLPIDTLKIDKEFIDDLTRDADDEAITSTIITMGHSLGLNVIAEGVETEAQLNFLRDHGCDEIQGHWLSRPIDADRCLEFIRGWAPESRLAALPLPD